MADTKNIFSSDPKLQVENAYTSPFRVGDLLDRGKLNKDDAQQLNTYLNWGVFSIPTEPDAKGEYLPKTSATASVTNSYTGVKSIFNNVHAISTSEMRQTSFNAPLLDTPGGRRQQRDLADCSIRSLVNNSGKRGRVVYDYADFAYCKYLNRVSNNYLITLRRFPQPAGDHIDWHQPIFEAEKEQNMHAPDIGRLVTWLGTPGNEMSSILKYSYKMNWKPLDANQDDQQLPEQSSPLAQLFNLTDKQYQQQVIQGYSSASAQPLFDKLLGGLPGSSDAPYTQLRDWKDDNKVYGPVDSIRRTNIRGLGLELEHKITLTFEYEMRSYNGINGRAAMLDLLGNVLAVTYNSGPFWQGGHRWTGEHQSNLFANLPIFKDASNGKLTSFPALVDSFSASISAVTNKMTDGGKKSFLDVAKDIISGLGGILLGGVLNKLGRPAKVGVPSLLSEAPTGCWHLMVGNPNDPILSIGNLILTNTTIEHYGPLGLDDFPTGLKVIVELDHGKDRDKDNIERMYMRGDNRIYSPMDKGIQQMYDRATTIQSKKKAASTNTSKQKKATESKSNASQGADKVDRAPLLSAAEKTSSEMNMDECLYKYFGITNQKLIMNASMESCFGQGQRKSNEKSGS